MFYGTGSRVFGGWEEESDWDFFAADDPDIEVLLLKLGFKKVRDSYHSRFTITVFRHECKIDVQLVSDVAAKQKVQRILLTCCRGRQMQKATMRHLWQETEKEFKVS